MNPLVHCIYASRATDLFDESQLPELLRHARAANARRGITGVLLFVEGNFFQVLEGEQATVTEVYEGIRLDPRHTRVTRIIQEPIVDRSFEEWTMGYARLTADELAQRVGVNDFFSTATCLDQLAPGRAKKLLQAFARGRWRAGETGLYRTAGRMS